MKVSIALATYNGAKYLEEQLSSFTCQTRKPDEVVVCDDGSTDDSFKILERYAHSAPFEVRLYRNERNLGYAKNFEKALSLCTGELIFLSDQDDVWLDSKIDVVSTHAARMPDCSVFVNNCIIATENLVSTGRRLFNQSDSSKRAQLGACMAIRQPFKEIFHDVPADVFGHDGWYAALSRGLGVKCDILEPLQYWRRHSTATSAFRLSNNIARKSRLIWRTITGEHVRLMRQRKQYLRRAVGKYSTLNGNVIPVTTAQQFLSALDLELALLDARLQLRSFPRIRRLRESLSLKRRREYQELYGYHHIITDILSIRERQI